MIIMFTIVVITGNLPLRWKRFQKGSPLLNLANAFSGGLFLSVGLCHLLPEAGEVFESYFSQEAEHTETEGDHKHLPWANLLCFVSFALILFIEKVAFSSHAHHFHHGDDGLSATLVAQNDKKIISQDIPLKDLSSIPSYEDYKKFTENRSSNLAQNQVQQFDPKSDGLEKPQHHHHDDLSEIGGASNFTDLTPYILQLAIGAHAVFEGMALGVETHKKNLIGIAAVILSHKWAEGFTLGLAFSRANVDLQMATRMITLQGLLNPLGIIIGWILSSTGGVMKGVCFAISAGTFLYIGIVDVLIEEFNFKRQRGLKFVLFLVAFIIVTLATLLEEVAGVED